MAHDVVATDRDLGVWATHRAGIRRRVIEAYLDRVTAGGTSAVSMPAVAERAGISVRTLYRYFPTKDDLQRVAAGWLGHEVRRSVDADPSNRRQRAEYLRHMWIGFAESLPVVEVQHTTVEGRQLRVRRLPSARATVDAALPAAIAGDRRTQVVDLLVAVTSSSMFLELVERMGHEPVEAAALVTELIDVIIDHEVGRAGHDHAPGGSDDPG